MYKHTDKYNSLLYGKGSLNVQQATYLFSTTFIDTKSDCNVINMLLPNTTWKPFLECFHKATNSTI